MSGPSRRRGRPPGPMPAHGTLARYQRRGDPCRCVRCRRANRQALAAWRARRRLDPTSHLTVDELAQRLEVDVDEARRIRSRGHWWTESALPGTAPAEISTPSEPSGHTAP